MDENKISFNLGTLKHFINNSLGLSYDDNKITGFELLNSIIDASAYNTYVETVSNKADTLHRYAHQAELDMMVCAYREWIGRLLTRVKVSDREVMLAFDYTDEDFYGEVIGLDLYPWTKEAAVTAKFKKIRHSSHT